MILDNPQPGSPPQGGGVAYVQTASAGESAASKRLATQLGLTRPEQPGSAQVLGNALGVNTKAPTTNWKKRIPTQWKETKQEEPAKKKPVLPKTGKATAEKAGSTATPPQVAPPAATPKDSPTPATPWGAQHDILGTLKEPPAGEAEGQPVALTASAALTGSEELSVSDDLAAPMPPPVSYSSIADTFNIGFSGEFTTLLVDNQVTGDATKSFEPEQRYFDESISIRGVGGYGLMNDDGEQPGQVVFGLGATASSKLFEPSWLIDRVNLGLITKEYALDLWTILPKFTDYTFNSKKLEGVSLLVNTRKNSLLMLVGRDNQLSKATGLHRLHYGFQLKRANAEKQRTWTANWLYTYDNQPQFGAAFKEKNEVASFGFEGTTKKFYKWDGEYVKSWANGGGTGDAYLLNLKKKKAAYLFKGGYEFVDLSFDTLGGNATPGKKETKLSLKWAFSKKMDLTVGYKDRDLFNNRTEEVPVIFNLDPLPGTRPKMKFNYKFTDKVLKSTGDKLHVVMNDLQLKDDLGVNQVKVKFLDETRDKLKTANQDKRQWEVGVDSELTEVWTLKTKYKHFSQKTLSRFNESSLNLSYSLDEWSDASVQYSFKDTQGARSDKENWTFSYNSLDVENDREYGFKFKRDGFRDFTVNSFELKLGLVY